MNYFILKNHVKIGNVETIRLLNYNQKLKYDAMNHHNAIIFTCPMTLIYLVFLSITLKIKAIVNY